MLPMTVMNYFLYLFVRTAQEYHKLFELNKKQATVLVVGAGFIGVEWATWQPKLMRFCRALQHALGIRKGIWSKRWAFCCCYGSVGVEISSSFKGSAKGAVLFGGSSGHGETLWDLNGWNFPCGRPARRHGGNLKKKLKQIGLWCFQASWIHLPNAGLNSSNVFKFHIHYTSTSW